MLTVNELDEICARDTAVGKIIPILHNQPASDRRALVEHVKEREKLVRAITEEISANGCEGPFAFVCVETTEKEQAWCRFCRIGMLITRASRETSETPPITHLQEK